MKIANLGGKREVVRKDRRVKVFVSSLRGEEAFLLMHKHCESEREMGVLTCLASVQISRTD